VLRLEPAAANGTSHNGTSHNGTSDNGTSDNGTSDNGAGENGTGHNGAAVNAAGHNGNGYGHDDPGAGDHVEALSECARRDGCTLIVVRDRLYAIVCPEMNALDTSRRLSDWLAEIDFDDATSGLLVSMTVVEYCGDDEEQAALPGSTLG
jgi:hypothetical protein